MGACSSVGGKILVTGGQGQLAQALVRHGASRVQLVGRPDFDFECLKTLEVVMAANNPSAVINAAAWTAVDLAESEPAAAARANIAGPELLARLCAQRSIPLLHISTDYVFDGAKGAPYIETDLTSACSVYGRTKAEGEKAVLAACSQSMIVRTAWLYSALGKNFVKTILMAGAKNPTLRVVDDQYGNPTSADDLAVALLSIMTRIEQTGWHKDYGGIYHASGSEATTWHGLAMSALQIATTHGWPMPDVQAIATRDWPTPSCRPMDTRLDCAKLAEVFSVVMPSWKNSLEPIIEQVILSC